MKNYLKNYIVYENTKIIDALKMIDVNCDGFVVVIDKSEHILGVLTDGDVRRGLIHGKPLDSLVIDFYTRNPVTIKNTASVENISEIFKDGKSKFIPIVSDEGKLENIITKEQMHTLLLQDIQFDLSYDFFSLDTSIVDHEIYHRPWGYYKTTVLNDYFQGKIISVKPGGTLSLQSHDHREEYWIVIHGNGKVQLDKSIIRVSSGSTVFIPLGCKHRLTNTDSKESLIITEVQIGDYFGEDDIHRYEDVYGRV